MVILLKFRFIIYTIPVLNTAIALLMNDLWNRRYSQQPFYVIIAPDYRGIYFLTWI